MLYKIGDFSSKVGISIKTLRYYDEIGIFKPSYTDIFSGYRYYEKDQVKKILLISKLKILGLSLDEIKVYLEKPDVQILINKMKGYEDKIKKINDFIDEKGKPSKYTVEKGDYKKYIEINGVKQSKCAQALEVRDKNSKYFVVEKDDEFYADFCIFEENNWLTLGEKFFFDNDFLDNVLPYIELEVDYFTCFIPVENEKTYNAIKTRFDKVEESDFNQSGYKFKRLKIKL